MKSSGQVELSVVMPCLNEARTIGNCVQKAHGFLTAHGVSGEVVIGDNGSTDGSGDVAGELGAKVVPVAQRGYGAAVMGAVAASSGRYIIFSDCDDSYDLSAIAPFLERLREGYDIVMGNRLHEGGIIPGAMPLMNRLIGNPGLSWLVRVMFHTDVQDVQCGLRAASREAFDRLDLRRFRFEFASEFVIRAVQLDMRIAQVPIVLHRDGRGRAPHLRPIPDGLRNLALMLRLRAQSPRLQRSGIEGAGK